MDPDAGGEGGRAATLARRFGRVSLTAALVVLVGLGVLLAGLWAWSRGTPPPIVDAQGRRVPGSISEKVFVEINGVRQGMVIRGRDRTNPVLLFVHGGPGMPEYFLSERYPTGLEDVFTVAWWDQRGAGLSYRAGMRTESMTLEQLTADTLAVTDYLRRRFEVEKIYLMAHSGGTSFAIQAAALSPERYHAYIGVGQMVDQLESEQIAYDYMLRVYRDRGNAGMVRRLEAAAPTPTWPLPRRYLALRDAAMHGAGVGTTRSMRSVVRGIFVPSLLTRQYTLVEKVNLWRGKVRSGALLRGPMFSLDLRKLVPTLEVPVYLLHGVYDYTCSYALARAYAEAIDAPVKGFYSFAESAHSPFFEEPARTMEILRKDVLTGRNALSDAASGS